MRSQDEIEIVERRAMFNYLVEHIRFDESCISDEGEAFIQETIKYLDVIQEGLERMAEKRAPLQKHYPLREIFEAINGEEEKSIELILKTIERLGDAQEQLEQLAESPIDFYQTKGTNELLYICQKFSNVYDSLA